MKRVSMVVSGLGRHCHRPVPPRWRAPKTHVAISGFWVFRSMKSVLQNNIGDAHCALLILAIHTLAFLVGARIMMYVRDARGQMVYGKAITRLLKF
ncbi:MAG TPA: hypothetical protein VKU19_32360 [Bryobacteraceae bacterium]|nr:hypothetical protein [Bryobacteraceae bacterium]